MTKAGFVRLIPISYVALCCELASPALSLAIAEGGEARFDAPRTTSGKSRELGHYEKNSVRNVFGKRVAATEKQELQYFKAIAEIPQEDAAVEASHAGSLAETNTPSQENSSASKNASLSPRDRIIADFGEPEKDAPVQAVENAPTPFKAMMASLEAGDDELAFRYAMQHARYMRKLQERNTRAIGITGLAMEKEGMVERGTWSKNPQFRSDAELLKSVDKETLKAEESVEAVNLPAKAKEMLEKALKEESEAPEGNLIFDEKAERARVRQALAGKVQPDPSGKVDIYFFFRARDSASQEMARKIQSIYDEGVKKGGINLIGLSLAPMGESEIRAFRKATGASFVLRDGQKLAPLMGVKTFPTTALVGQKNGQAYLIQGSKPLYEIQETLSLMEGK